MLELALIAAGSVMIFGRNLPKVAAQGYTHFQRARKALQAVWRESGIGEEIRQVQQEMNRTAETLRKVSPHAIARDAMRDLEDDVRAPVAAASGPPPPSLPLGVPQEETSTSKPVVQRNEGVASSEETTEEPSEVSDALEDGNGTAEEADEGAEIDEPSAEASRRPPWYPSTMDDPFQSKAD